MPFSSPLSSGCGLGHWMQTKTTLNNWLAKVSTLQVLLSFKIVDFVPHGIYKKYFFAN